MLIQRVPRRASRVDALFVCGRRGLLRAAAAAALLALAGCALNPVTGRSDFVLMSEEQELALGARYHGEIIKAQGRYEDPRLQAMVQRIGRALAAVSHRPEIDYQFTLLDSSEVNAFALPGGYIYITRGLLAYLGSEAELAAVLGHELGHVTARHSVRQQSAATVTGLIGAVIGAHAGSGAADLAGLAGTALVRGYGREHELEADRLGAQYLARAGYDHNAMTRVIGVLKDQELFEVEQARREGREAQVYHGVFATHPANDRRLQEVVAEAASLRTAALRVEDRAQFLRALDGLVFGDSESQGMVRGNRFYHGPLGIRMVFPDGWRILNRPDRLLAVAPERDALIQLETVAAKPGADPAELLRQAVGERALRAEFSLDDAGVRGRGATVRIDTPFGPRDGRVAAVLVGEHGFLLSAAAKPEAWPLDLARGVSESFRSLGPLADAERPLARARRIKIVTVAAGQSLEALARGDPSLERAADRLRLLNGWYPAGQPRAGELAKVVVR